MKNKYRYISNMGLAFDEDRILNKFSKMAEEGWILKEMSFLRYKLVKEEPKKLIYSVDYNELDNNDDAYFDLFKSSGWQHMCSYGPFHFFSASPNTVPIYTDKKTYLSKYKKPKIFYRKAFGVSSISLILVALIEIFYGNKIDSIIIKNLLLGVGTISAAIAVPSLMVNIAYLIKSQK